MTSFDDIVNRKKGRKLDQKVSMGLVYKILFKKKMKLLFLVLYTIIFVGYIHFQKDKKIAEVILTYETLFEKHGSH